MNTVWRVLTRKKVLDSVSVEQSELGRVLNTFDLTALGVGSTLGVGVYVLVGHVAKDVAGPAVILSFLLAAVASVFAGLCYAEFGARAPRAGSAYIYSYVCVGEFVAFVIGWNLILEYVIGSASVARGLSLYLDTLVNNTLKNTFIDIAPINGVTWMSAYFDFFAFGMSLLLAVALAFGMKESSKINNIVTFLNVSVVVFVIIAGAIKSNPKNWSLDPPANRNATVVGSGGFFPFGIEGMIKGAATCFYGFVGFDCIATTGEEVKNPKRAIPISIIVSLFIIFLAYFGTSTVVTLMIPYYDQDPNAPIPHAFESVGWEVPKWIVTIGGIFGLCASLFGAMFPLPRIIYAMASDSLVFRFLGKVSSRFKTPVTGTLLAGLLTGLMAALFDLTQLVDMMSIGTLLAYTIVAASVLLLRYETEKGDVYEPLLTAESPDSDESEAYTGNRGLGEDTTQEEIELSENLASSSIWKQIFNYGRAENPTETSEKIVKFEVCLYCILCILVGLCALYLKKPISRGEIWAIVLTAIVVCVTVLVVMSIATQPKSRKELSFKVPLVPLIPALSILVNVYLMLTLDTTTWIRFGVWMLLGIPTYYFSVQTHSDARNESLASDSTTRNSNKKMNGFTNRTFLNDEEIIQKSTPPRPTLIRIESTIAVLDEILENEEASIIHNDRKFSIDSLSTASNVLCEENVEADVHCADVPITPILVLSQAPPLLKSSDVNATSSSPSDVLDSPVALVAEMSPIVDPTAVLDDESNKTVDYQLTIDEDDPVVDDLVVAIPPPPPPPPPILSDTSEVAPVSIARPEFSIGAITNVKLRHVEIAPKLPPTDDSQKNRERRHSDENIKFGSLEHTEFLEKLGKQLQQGGYIPVPIIGNLIKKLSFKSTPSLPNEDVIEDSINKIDAKEKLAQHLATRRSFLPSPHKPLNIRTIKGAPLASAGDKNQSDYKEQHRQNMRNILGSIRLRKDDSFKVDSDSTEPDEKEENEKEDSDKNSDHLRHRQNMQKIFGTLKLRKEESFKIDDDSPKTDVPEENKKILNPDVGKNDRMQHGQNMDSIFRSIRLRKVDSFKLDEGSKVQ